MIGYMHICENCHSMCGWISKSQYSLQNKIIVFQNTELTSPFIIEELAIELGYDVEYVSDAESLQVMNTR